MTLAKSLNFPICKKESVKNTHLPGFQRDRMIVHKPGCALFRRYKTQQQVTTGQLGSKPGAAWAWTSSLSMRSGPTARPDRHCGRRPGGWQVPGPKMAAPSAVAAATSSERDGGGSGFESWLDGRLEALGVDRAVYGAYILGVLQEEEEEEKLDALQGILSAFLVRSLDTFL